jgi:hypothetical protein
VEKVYTREGGEFDIVFNLAAETKYGQADEIYDEKVLKISLTVAKEAAKRKIPIFVEVSTAQVYESSKVFFYLTRNHLMKTLNRNHGQSLLNTSLKQKNKSGRLKGML